MRSSRRGIILISILILTLIATFFIGALVQMNPSRLRRTVQDESRDRAAGAARIGVDYALNRLSSDQDWKAGGTGETVSLDDLVIREDNGNVLGWVRTDNSSWVGFRMRFNHQDGNPPSDNGEDGLNDPTYFIHSAGISVNNLNGGGPVVAKLGNDGSNYSATPTSLSGLTVPVDRVSLIVEGIVAPDLDPSQPRTLAEAQSVSTRTIDGLYKISKIHTGLDGDAVWSAGGYSAFNFHSNSSVLPTPGGEDLAAGLHLKSDPENTARIRVKGQMKVARLDDSVSSTLFHPDERAEVLAGSSFGVFPSGTELPEDPFLRIDYDNIDQTDQTGRIQIPGGVYIFKRGNLDGASRTKSADVQYFNLTWEQYRSAMLSGTPPTPDTMPAGFLPLVELDAKTVTRADGSTETRDVITFDRDVELNGGVGELTIIPERGARQKAGEDTVPAGDPIFQSLNQIDPLQRPGAATALMQGAADQLFSGATSTLVFRMPGTSTFQTISFVGGGVAVQPPVFPSGYSNDPNEYFLELIYNGNVLNGIGNTYDTLVDAGAGVTPTGTGSELQISDPQAFIDFLMQGTPQSAPFYITSDGTDGTPDPFHIPKVDPDTGAPISSDETVPQDIEIHFAPSGEETAYIRSSSDLFLGTHLSGDGGVISGGKLSIIGFGVDLTAGDGSEQDGLALYGKDGITISTYDHRKGHYWHVDLAGVIYTDGDLQLRLGEENIPSLPVDDQPSWGRFNFSGALVALGESGYYEPGHYEGVAPETTDPGPNVGTETASGQTVVTAHSACLFYDPSYLAPFLEAGVLSPAFTPVSEIQR